MDRVRLGELAAATSLFTDLGTGQPVEHGLRTTLVSMRLADALGLEPEQSRDLFYVTMLRFLGCTADSHQAAGLFGGDDLGLFSRMAPFTMGSPLEELKGLATTATDMVGLPRSVLAVIGALADARSKDSLLGAHCEVASRLASDMGLPNSVSGALLMAYARWDARGVPRGVGGADIPISIRVSVVARDLELWARDFGADQAVETLRSRRERAYDPTVVDAALDIGCERMRRCEEDLWDTVIGLEPKPMLEVAGEGVERALRALGDFADLKTPQFTGHARRVEEIVTGAADVVGLGAERKRTLALAGSVHDLGVVAAPVSTWWPSDPSPGEAERARLHPMWSERLLMRVDRLHLPATLVGTHHERLDGSGYPAGSQGDLSLDAELLACAELYDEGLRRARDEQAVIAEMRQIAISGGLSGVAINAVLSAVDAHAPLIEVDRPAGLTEREIDVLRLLTHGKTNRQIAAQLGIRVKTVGSHVEHIYSKAGVHSRAAATLFAIEHGLIRR
jgi:response regulator RpfG family c-di-GMP phosphodiesterase/DNA-binding CsgD family transcriptional regulator